MGSVAVLVTSKWACSEKSANLIFCNSDFYEDVKKLLLSTRKQMKKQESIAEKKCNKRNGSPNDNSLRVPYFSCSEKIYTTLLDF